MDTYTSNSRSETTLIYKRGGNIVKRPDILPQNYSLHGPTVSHPPEPTTWEFALKSLGN
jgi:homogentisate 1,2-dioxygenase